MWRVTRADEATESFTVGLYVCIQLPECEVFSWENNDFSIWKISDCMLCSR